MDVQSNWWSSFFSGPAVEFWINAVSAEHTAASVAYAIDRLRLQRGATVLDVACGSGRVSNALANRGFNVVGVDISAEFLAYARRDDPHGRVEWRHGDMRDLPWSARFDGAVCLGNSFAYLDDEGNAAFINAVAQALKPGARLLLETHAIAESVLPHFESHTWVRAADIYLLIESAYDYATSRVDTEYTFVRHARVDARRASQRIYLYRQLADLLESAGMSVVGVEALDDNAAVRNPYQKSGIVTKPFGLGAPLMLLTAERR